jgi:hypothetical protein
LRRIVVAVQASAREQVGGGRTGGRQFRISSAACGKERSTHTHERRIREVVGPSTVA